MTLSAVQRAVLSIAMVMGGFALGRYHASLTDGTEFELGMTYWLFFMAAALGAFGGAYAQSQRAGGKQK